MRPQVTAISNIPDKAADVRQFGAHRFVASVDPEPIKNLGASLDLLLSTVTASLEWEAESELAVTIGNGITSER